MARVDMSNVKPASIGFWLCTVCERGDTPHVEHNGPYVVIDGAMLEEYWEERDAWVSVRAWYICKIR